MQVTCGCVGVWVVMLMMVGVGVVTPPPTQAVAAPTPCCGRGAAAGLGFVGGFVVGRHRRRWHGGGCGGGCGGGWCGGCGYGRRRRSLDEVMGRDILEDIFFRIASLDEEECGLRLVCELAGRDPQTLTPDELIILLPYRGRDESDEKSYYGRYDKAVWQGQKRNPCHKLYPLCPYPAEVVMGYAQPNGTISTL